LKKPPFSAEKMSKYAEKHGLKPIFPCRAKHAAGKDKFLIEIYVLINS
jgi:hypothetical protein